jgi:hypothetical protein
MGATFLECSAEKGQNIVELLNEIVWYCCNPKATSTLEPQEDKAEGLSNIATP